MTPAEELAQRKAQLRAREGRGGMSKNVTDLKRRIAELEAEDARN